MATSSFYGRTTTLCLAISVAGLLMSTPAADGPDAAALLTKGIHSLGGEAALAKVRGITWKTKGQLNWNGAENPFTGLNTFKDWHHARLEFEGEFGGNPVRGVTILDGDKGSRDLAGQQTDLDADGLANERRNLMLQLVPALLLPLKDKSQGFTLQSATRSKVGERAVVDLKYRPKTGKEFTLTLDEETGRPVRITGSVSDWSGVEVTQEITFSAYKEMSGIQKATKLSYKRDGERLLELEITEFKTTE